MSHEQHLSQEDLSLYALQLLAEGELRDAMQHVEGCAECSEEIARLQGDLVAYALSAEGSEPPVRSRERFLRRVAQEPRMAPPEVALERAEPLLVQRRNEAPVELSEEEPARKSVAPLLAWTGWAIAAGLAVAGGLQYHARVQAERELSAETARLDESDTQMARAQQSLATLTEAGAMQVALRPPAVKEPPRPGAHAAYLPEKGSLVLIATHLQPLQSYKTYELWLLPAQADLAPIPAGLFKPDADGNASLVMPDMPKGVHAKGFGITVEDEGGSKQPTLPIVLAGT